MLPFQGQRLTARGEHPDVGCGGEQPGHELSNRVDEVLTVVHDEQQLAGLEVGRHGILDRLAAGIEAEGACDLARQ